MLLYHNRSFARLVCTSYGSVFFEPTTFSMALFVMLLTLAIQWMLETENEYAPQFPHHYGMHALGAVIGFAVVFRTSLAWNRYWEACSQLQFMYCKWADAFMQIYAFIAVSVAKCDGNTADGKAKKERLRNAVDSIEYYLSLMSAMAASRLSHGDNQRMECRAEDGLPWRHRIALREHLREQCEGEGDFQSAMPLLKWRRVERHSVLGEDAFPGTDETPMSELVFTLNQGQPTEEEMSILSNSSDRVSVTMYWTLHEIAKITGDVTIPPPIQSRIFQELSNGMLGFSQALKIADIPFPFPYAQLLALELLAFCLFIPVYVAFFTQSLIAGPIVSFFLFQGIWGLNEVAKELENPFGSDVNDINLVDYHSRFVDLLVEVCGAHKATVNKPSGASQFFHKRMAIKSSQLEGKEAKAQEKVEATAEKPSQVGEKGGTATPEAAVSQEAPAASIPMSSASLPAASSRSASPGGRSATSIGLQLPLGALDDERRVLEDNVLYLQKQMERHLSQISDEIRKVAGVMIAQHTPGSRTVGSEGLLDPSMIKETARLDNDPATAAHHGTGAGERSAPRPSGERPSVAPRFIHKEL
eukprot:TRINITY_DN4026_c0_g1_i2.p1 TRINITY_DN4026_c0_g1~~TRINITY_DN4026_c0_g1_i2.p1  ORF type:complete len:586 (-),score=102.28 TRINITY_DN4026_c0_g1_i2:47-1804(-)